MGGQLVSGAEHMGMRGVAVGAWLLGQGRANICGAWAMGMDMAGGQI